jgi:hypothetical protein
VPALRCPGSLEVASDFQIKEGACIVSKELCSVTEAGGRLRIYFPLSGSRVLNDCVLDYLPHTLRDTYFSQEPQFCNDILIATTLGSLIASVQF